VQSIQKITTRRLEIFARDSLQLSRINYAGDKFKEALMKALGGT
jgi:hypothetical protein